MTKGRGRERRRAPRASVKARVEVDFQIDSEDTFLFEYITNVSRDGIFLQTRTPLEVGTELRLRFDLPEEGRAIQATGKVIWINPYRPEGENLNPGMGIQFIKLSKADKEAISRVVRKKAYLAEDD